MSGHIPSPPAHGAFISFDESSVTHLHAAAGPEKSCARAKYRLKKIIGWETISRPRFHSRSARANIVSAIKHLDSPARYNLPS